MKTSFAPSQIQHVNGNHIESRSDLLAVEEPLEIRLVFGPTATRVEHNVTVTMRTPGHDVELTLGFLFTERIIESYDEVENIQADNADENIVTVELKQEVKVDLEKLQRNFYTTSSCGVCGKSSIDSVLVKPKADLKQSVKVSSGLIQELPEKLSSHQTVFGYTGGLHAVSLFSDKGEILMTYEDVGRHNAFDKVIGACLIKNMLPASDNILLVSGRASFELVQKAVVSGIQIMAAVSAPSSLAVELAKKFNLTLLGFVRNGRFNIYSGEERISV